MKYLLDTSICIHFFRGQFDLLEKFRETGLGNCAISEISLAELVYGAESSSQPEKNFKLIENFTEQVTILPIFDAIGVYAKQKVNLRKKGSLISDFDLLIGATAIAHEMIMVTENTRDFERLKDLQIENWINR